MYLLRSSVRDLSALELHLAERLAEELAIRTGARPSPGEMRSWSRSIPALRADLVDAGLGDVEMLVEYQLPLTSKRADVVLAGVHPESGDPSYVVVELKQWTEAELFEGNDALVRVGGYGQYGFLHPGLQVEGYCTHLADFTAVLARESHSLAGATYLHNATDSGVADLYERSEGDRSRVFTGERKEQFVGFLRSRLASGRSGRDSAELLFTSATEPSRKLLDVAADEVQRRERFVLLDEQRAAYEHVLHAVERARRQSTKTAVIVTGGPGSGKSVIALSLMGELSRQGCTVMHATGSRSFTQTLRKVAGARAPRVRNLFAYFNSFMTAEPDSLDCLILDEAHRLRETSVNRYTRRELRERGRPQVDELLATAKVPVFLLDEHQVVRPGEMGTADDIEAAAHRAGLQVETIKLDTQFRSGGSRLYVDWVLRLLDLAPGGAVPWRGDGAFEVHLVGSPNELEARLARLNTGGETARIAAGYCWPWSDPTTDGQLVPDVQIDGWARPWNLRGDRGVGGAPPSALWATNPAGFGQVGCIYTAQGFEYDHAGVIIGPYLVRRDGRWVIVREANRDPEFRSRQAVDDRTVARLIRNVYKVLLTRAMRSVHIYSTDPQTRAFLRSLMHA